MFDYVIRILLIWQYITNITVPGASLNCYGPDYNTQ